MKKRSNTKGNNPNEFHQLEPDKQETLLRWIETNLYAIKTFNRMNSSYGLKHLFEKDPEGFYITNGQFKGAMLKAGYKVYKDSEKDYIINWHFNVSRKAIKQLRARYNEII